MVDAIKSALFSLVLQWSNYLKLPTVVFQYDTHDHNTIVSSNIHQLSNVHITVQF